MKTEIADLVPSKKQMKKAAPDLSLDEFMQIFPSKREVRKAAKRASKSTRKSTKAVAKKVNKNTPSKRQAKKQVDGWMDAVSWGTIAGLGSASFGDRLWGDNRNRTIGVAAGATALVIFRKPIWRGLRWGFSKLTTGFNSSDGAPDAESNGSGDPARMARTNTDDMHDYDAAVAGSFPASDPPGNW